jgi:hypothetical protein
VKTNICIWDKIDRGKVLLYSAHVLYGDVIGFLSRQCDTYRLSSRREGSGTYVDAFVTAHFPCARHRIIRGCQCPFSGLLFINMC